MRVAVLADIHGNVPALDAVLAEVGCVAPDAIVVAGDVAAGPMPLQTLDRLHRLGERVVLRFVMGNGDREMVEAFDGTGSGVDPSGGVITWAAAQLDRDQRDALAAYEPAVTLDVDGLGPTRFCHGSPRSDTEMLTIFSPAARGRPARTR